MSGRPGSIKCTLPTGVHKVKDKGWDFINAPEVIKKVHNPSRMVELVFEEVFNMPFDMRSGVEYKDHKVREFTNRLGEIRRAVRSDKLTGRLGEFFYNTSARAKMFPHANQLLNLMIDTNYAYKGRQDRHNRMFNELVDGIKLHVKAEGLTGMFPKWEFTKAVKEAENFDIAIRKLELSSAQGNNKARSELVQMRRMEEKFYKEGEGKIFKDIIDMIENKFTAKKKEILEEKYYGPRRELIEKKLEEGWSYEQAWKFAKRTTKKPKDVQDILHEVTPSEPLRKVLETHLELMDNMYVVLDRGVGAYIRGIKASLKGKGYPVEQIDVISAKIREKIKPKKEGGGFYPHFRREMNMEFLSGLMPHFENISNAMTKSNTGDFTSLETAIKDINTFLTPRARARANNYEGFDYSQNFIPNIKRYVNEIDRFNYLAHADMYTKEILNEVKDMFVGGKLDGYGQSAVKLIHEMNMSMKGNVGFKSERLESITRAILGMEYVSKLGFNFRTSARNATQWFLNVVEFGPIMMKQSKKFYAHNQKLEATVEKLLDESGLKFAEATAELEEVVGGRHGKFAFKMAGKEIVLNEKNMFEKFESGVSKIAGSTVVSGMMRTIENGNRRSTFKYAFYKMYNELDLSREYKDTARSKGKNVEQDMVTKARRYAIRMTSLLHFDYSALSKSQYLKHPVGRLLGQFQHYLFKFVEYNWNTGKKALSDVAHNVGMMEKFYGPNSSKMARMGFIYALAPAFAATLTGLDFGGLVQHAGVDKLNQMGALFMGDEKDIEKAFHGRGVGTGIIGAAIISDSLAIGNIFEWWRMPDNDMVKLATGLKDYANVTGDRKTFEIINILNTQVGRARYQSLPLLFSGYPGTALQFELGVYPTKESKDFRKKASDKLNRLLPADLQHAFAQFEEGTKAGKRNPFGTVSAAQSDDPFAEGGPFGTGGGII